MFKSFTDPASWSERETLRSAPRLSSVPRPRPPHLEMEAQSTRTHSPPAKAPDFLIAMGRHARNLPSLAQVRASLGCFPADVGTETHSKGSASKFNTTANAKSCPQTNSKTVPLSCSGHEPELKFNMCTGDSTLNIVKHFASHLFWTGSLKINILNTKTPSPSQEGDAGLGVQNAPWPMTFNLQDFPGPRRGS